MSTIRVIYMLVFALLNTIVVTGQTKKIYKTRGFFFFSASYDKFLSLIDKQHDFDFPVISDFFVPAKFMPKQGKITETFVTENLRKGIRLENVFANRENLRSKALVFLNSDTTNDCYLDKAYRILPVEVSYEIINNAQFYIPCQEYLRLITNGRSIKFGLTSKNIRFLSIYVLDEYLTDLKNFGL